VCSLRLPIWQFKSKARAVALLCVAVGPITWAAPAQDPQRPAPQSAAASQTAHGDMADRSGHLYMTTLRPAKVGDRQKADAVVAAAKVAMAPYRDYHKALSDGYEIFLPNTPQSQYHFTQYAYDNMDHSRHAGNDDELGMACATLGRARHYCYDPECSLAIGLSRESPAPKVSRIAEGASPARKRSGNSNGRPRCDRQPSRNGELWRVMDLGAPSTEGVRRIGA
jgi:hypothetical protein